MSTAFYAAKFDASHWVFAVDVGVQKWYQSESRPNIPIRLLYTP